MTPDARPDDSSLPLLHTAVSLDSSPTALERFIAEYVHPRLRRPDLPNKTWADWQLLVMAAKRKRVRSTRVGSQNRVFWRGDQTIGGLGESGTTLISAMAEDIQSRRSSVTRCLEVAGVPTVSARHFAPDDDGAARSAFREMGTPVALMPDFLCGGRGVTTQIRTEDEFSEGWKVALWAHDKHGPGADSDEPGQVRMEADATGISVSAYVVGETLTAAAVLLPLYVVGDGRSTVAELLQDLLRRREQHSLLKRYPVSVSDKQLMARGIDRNQVLSRGRVCFLRRRASLAVGGVPVDVTDSLPDDLRELAVSAVWAIPGLSAGQVEISTASLSDTSEACVTAVDGQASFRVHHYPVIGRPRNVAEALVQSMVDHGRD